MPMHSNQRNRAAILVPATPSPTASASRTIPTARTTVDVAPNACANGKDANARQSRVRYATLRNALASSLCANVTHAYARGVHSGTILYLLFCATQFSHLTNYPRRALGLPQPLKEPKAEEELGEGEPRKKKKDYVCGNMAIQLGLSKKTKVRRGRWGMGLYIMENARKGDLISEYIGELVYEPTTKSREYITRHLGRGYLFDLNKKMAVDSSLAGNEARYINHDEKNYNCHATIRNVQGEHRIGFFASKFIPKGSEILINYGSEFFKDKAVDSTQNPNWRVVSTMNETAITAAMRTPRGKAQSVGVPTNLQMMDDDDDWDLDTKEEEGEQSGLGCTREETPDVWEERRGGEVEEAQTMEEVEGLTSDASYQPPSLGSRSGSTSP